MVEKSSTLLSSEFTVVRHTPEFLEPNKPICLQDAGADLRLVWSNRFKDSLCTAGDCLRYELSAGTVKGSTNILRRTLVASAEHRFPKTSLPDAEVVL